MQLLADDYCAATLRMDADALLSAVQWEVCKALAPVADDDMLEGCAAWVWAACIQLDSNVEAITDELQSVRVTLEMASGKQLGGPAIEEGLRSLRDSVHNADDLLDELDYFRVHDGIKGTYHAADMDPNCLSARAHTIRDDEEASRCMHKLGKLLRCSSSPHPLVDDDDDRGDEQETPKLEFNRVDFSQRATYTIEQLKILHDEVNKILQSCGPKIVQDIAQSHPVTPDQIIGPTLHAKDNVMNIIIHDITKGQYCDKGLTVLPIVGPGGTGKTTLMQHIYHSQQVQTHFPVMIWICVSFAFNLAEVLEQIKTCTPQVENEKRGSKTQELIEQRLKSKRFLLVLDDVWQVNEDWGSLLSILDKSQEKGSMILLTTRLPAIAQKLQTTNHSIDLRDIESEEFRKLFLTVVFGDEECPMDKQFLLETGDKIIEKLKGSPLAAKVVGTLLSKDLSLHHWRRVLESKEWETNDDGIMVALKHSYDILPFHLQQCFAYSALFPEDYRYRSKDLISLWIALDILIPSGQNQTFEDIGLSYLNVLVSHGFFREEEADGDRCYVMHYLLHGLALKVASHDCLSLRLADAELVEIQPSTRHLSMSTKDLGEYNAVFGEKIKSNLAEMKTRLKVEHLQTLMLFGEMDEKFANIFADFFLEANALRVLHLPNMICPVESMLHNFSGLVHLRYLCLGTQDWQMHLPLSISKFYHLRILDLESWDGSLDISEDMTNLAKLCHFYTSYDELDIYNVGKLKLLQKLKVFRVNKECEGFEPKQLEQLTKIRELGIYNLEKIHTKEEAAQAKLIEKNCLKKLTLAWDSEQSIFEPIVEAVVLESLQPHRDLQELCIRGHSGPCPTWLGDKLSVEDLQYLCLVGVSWKALPSVGKMWNLRKLVLKNIATVKNFVIEQSYCRLIWFEIVGLENLEKWVPSGDTEHMFPLLQVLIIRDCPKLLAFPFSNHIDYRPDQGIDWFPRLQELQIQYCPELLLVPPMPFTETLSYVSIRGVKLLEMLLFSKPYREVTLDIVGNDYLHNLDQVLAFNNLTRLEKLSLVKCPPLELKHHVMLTSLKTLIAESSDALVEHLGGQRDIVECLPAPPLGAFNTYDEGIIGIEHARDEFAQILCKGGNQLKIVSVVGFGGLGKTTLVKAVYDKLNMQFDCRAFVPVSQNPDMRKVFMDILNDLHLKENYLDDRGKDGEQLIREIKNFLWTKRYLIVIDDLWDAKSWNIISSSLPSNDCTSRIIVTTRVDKIAEKCCSKNKDLIYNIMPLGYENSKELFLKKCCGSEDSSRDALAEVDEILEICSGMPLAIISIASAFFPFSAGKVKEQYQEIMKSLHSATRELHYLEEFARILSCRYSDLPKTLRDCLLYLAASAKNQGIQRDNLVRKWIAEGLIPEDKDCNREEVAGRYFDELINRNVIQPVKHAHCLGKDTFQVTYMMLYVLRQLSQKENFATFLSGSEPHVEVKPTRLFIQSSDSELPASTDRVNLTNVRSVTMLGPANPVSFKRLKNVQLLDLDCCKDLENSAMDDICLMIKLKYLSLKLTKVTALPPQIGKLQNLETLDVSRTQISSLPREISGLQNLDTLDVSRTQISNLPPEIGKLQSLITLDASKTQISNLPPEISNLQSLETLDVRQTQVKELPKEVLQLRKIKYLHFGQSGWFGVKLPVGIDQLESVQVMGTIDSRECSESAVKEISELIPKEVKELQVVMYDGPADMDRNDKLLSSVGKCSKLKSLTIYGDSNPSDELSPKSPPGSPYFPQLEKLKVAGRFVKVPGWIAQLTTLTLLVIRVCKLEENDLVIIGGLPCLSALTVAPVTLPRKQVNITSSAGFARLEVFCFDCRMPWVSFWERAMPNLKQLQLKLYSGPVDKVPSGIMLLERLNTVILLYSSQYAGDDGVTETVAVIREDAASHANQIEVSINGDREIFSSNRSADMGVAGTEFVKNVSRVIAETEIEEVLASE